ncbi:MAG: ATPase [Clostridia bacterium]|nr:ATPase [Clostridia bacterium]
MEIFTLLETLEEMIENSKKVPFTDKCIVEREDIFDIVKEIRLKLPDELKQAKWVKEERSRIMEEAQKEADDIVKEAENRIIAMIDEHEITKKAYEEKAKIIETANQMSKEMSEGTKEYADNILGDIEGTINTLKSNMSIIEATMNNALETIKNNRKELK